MNNTEIVFRVSIFNIIVSQVALALGITTSVIESASPLAFNEDVSIAEALLFPITLIINNLGSIAQLLTFQVNIPPIWNTLIFTPVALTLIYMIISLFRGSS